MAKRIVLSHELTADYDQGWLFPPTLDELLPADPPVRFIRDLVKSLNLPALGLTATAPGPGRPAYAPGLLLSIWLYGYFLRIYSARALEAACYDQLGLLWLAGGHHPDHNTLWRFVHEHRNLLKMLFTQSVRVAHPCGLIGLVLHAVDGTKLEAACSRRTSWRRSSRRRASVGLPGGAWQACRGSGRSSRWCSTCGNSGRCGGPASSVGRPRSLRPNGGPAITGVPVVGGLCERTGVPEPRQSETWKADPGK